MVALVAYREYPTELASVEVGLATMPAKCTAYCPAGPAACRFIWLCIPSVIAAIWLEAVWRVTREDVNHRGCNTFGGLIGNFGFVKTTQVSYLFTQAGFCSLWARKDAQRFINFFRLNAVQLHSHS